MLRECAQSIPHIKLPLYGSFLEKILGPKFMKKSRKFHFFLGHPVPIENIKFSRQLAYRTEVIKNTSNPEWKPFDLSPRQLCQGDKTK